MIINGNFPNVFSLNIIFFILFLFYFIFKYYIIIIIKLYYLSSYPNEESESVPLKGQRDFIKGLVGQ